MAEIPTIDLADDEGRLLKALDRACGEVGLFYLENHELDADLLARVRTSSGQFFERPEAARRAVSQPSDDCIRGYIGVGNAALARSRGEESLPDLKESFNMGPPQRPEGQIEGHHAPNVWPDKPADFREVWEDCYRRMEALASILLRHLAVALKLDETFFLDRSREHVSVLGAIRYPPQDRQPEDGQLRSGTHSDFGSLTILQLDDAPGGLQAWSDAEGWLDIPARTDCLVVNLGDCMARWTNGRWKSPLHRVVNPPPGSASMSGRLTIGFFHHPSPRTIIEPVPSCVTAAWPPAFEPLRFGDHLHRQFTRQQRDG